jgi:hypothetical protein
MRAGMDRFSLYYTRKKGNVSIFCGIFVRWLFACRGLVFIESTQFLTSVCVVIFNGKGNRQ